MDCFLDFYVSVFKERFMRKTYTMKKRLGNYCNILLHFAKKRTNCTKKRIGTLLFTCSSELSPLFTNFSQAYFIIDYMFITIFSKQHYVIKMPQRVEFQLFYRICVSGWPFNDCSFPASNVSNFFY